jgi:hypothetical protein
VLHGIGSSCRKVYYAVYCSGISFLKFSSIHVVCTYTGVRAGVYRIDLVI